MPCEECEERTEEECLLQYHPMGQYCQQQGYEGYIACADVGAGCGCEEPGPPCCAMVCIVQEAP
jgi:hypothetical protein